MEQELLKKRDYDDCIAFAQRLVNERNDGKQIDITTCEYSLFTRGKEIKIIYANSHYVLLWIENGIFGSGAVTTRKKYKLWQEGNTIDVTLIFPSPRWRFQLCERLQNDNTQ